MAVMSALLQIKANVSGAASIDKLGKSLGGVQSRASSLSKGLGGLATSAGAVTSALTAIAAGGALKGVMDTFGGYQADIMALERGLQNLGGNAPQHLEPLKQLASDLGEQTLFNEEDFNKGFGLLTSFGNIGVDQYERVARAASDVAQISGTDVSSALMQMAKALNAPSQGVSALGRSGIQFTDAQKEMIKSMEEAGNVAGAQELIFKELEKQYGGASLAAAGGFAGAMDTLGEKFYDVQKALGPLLEAGLTPLIGLLTATADIIGNQIIPVFNNLPGPLKTVVGLVTTLSVGLIALAPVLGIITPGLVQLGAVLGGLKIGAMLTGLVGTIGSLIGALTGGGGLLAAIAAVFTGPVGWIALLVGAGVAIYAFRDQIGGALKAIGQFFVDGFNAIGDILKAAGQAYLDYYVKPVLGFAQSMWDGIVNLFNTLQQAFLDTFVTPAIELAQRAWDGIVDIFNRLPDAIKAPFIAVSQMIQNVWNGILTFVTNSLNSFIKKVNAAINLANKLPSISIPNIPLVPGPQQQAPSFAGGGYTGDGPRVGGVDGKGGFPAILHPRERVIDLAAGGAALPAGGGSVAMQPAQINITTGPVMQAENQNWVSMQDLQKAMRATEAATMARLRTYAGRRAVGVA